MQKMYIRLSYLFAIYVVKSSLKGNLEILTTNYTELSTYYPKLVFFNDEHQYIFTNNKWHPYARFPLLVNLPKKYLSLAFLENGSQVKKNNGQCT